MRHGTHYAYRHGCRCGECREANRLRMLDYRRRNGAKPRRKPRCGTVSGAVTHRKNGDQPCEPCREAYNEWQRARYRGERTAKKGQRAPISDLIVDVLETFDYPMSSAVLADHVTRIRPDVTWKSVRSIVSRMASSGALFEKNPGEWWTT